jgi:thymidylate synthase
MNQLDKQYQELLQDIMHNGVHKETRNGKTISRFGKQIRHNMKDGFPLLTTKKMYWKGIVTELLWFLRGDTNIKFLVDNDCHIWDGDAYKSYSDHFIGYEDVPNKELFIEQIKTDDDFAKKWGELGPVYGKQWRKWKKSDSFIVEDDVWKNNEGWCSLRDFNKDELYIDQIQNLINDLKTNPDSRRLMVNAWNVAEIDQMTLPPCHYGFQVYTRELSWEERRELMTDDIARGRVLDKNGLNQGDFGDLSPFTEKMIHYWMNQFNIPSRAISLMWNQRSVDTFLGLPFNIASYGLLLEILAKMTNMIPDELIGNLGDVHLYQDHLSQAREQITREPFRLPKLEINDQYWVIDCDLDTHILSMLIEDFQVKKYQSHPTIKVQLSN